MYKEDTDRPTGVFSASTSSNYVVSIPTADIPRKLAQLLGLTRGPREHYDLACTSSHAATHKATESIARGDCEVALVVGASLLLQPESSFYLLENGILSRTGVSRPLDDQSDGLVMGEAICKSSLTATSRPTVP
jgi:acyl transferase domain-containing protein